jgi:thiol-disulfide isomerase/thioredoxin
VNKKAWVALAALGVVVAIAVYRHKSGSAGTGGALHKPAPDFELTDLNKQTVKLSSYRGKPVLLNFWATWCAPCRDETPHLVQLQDEYRGQGLQLIGVSLDDDPEPVRPFADEFHINYPIVVGNAQLADRFGGILGLPVTFLVGCDGNIAGRHIGELNFTDLEAELKPLLQDGSCAVRK